MLSDIVSDRDTPSTSDVFRGFCDSLQIQENMSVTYRPQTDGQTERINQYVEVILRAWTKWMGSFFQCFINNAYQAPIQTFPFFLNYCDYPSTPTDTAVPLRGVTPDERIQLIHSAIVCARTCLSEAQTCMADLCNRQKHRIVILLVALSCYTQKLSTTLCRL